MKGLRGIFFLSIIIGIILVFSNLFSKQLLFSFGKVAFVFDSLCTEQLQDQMKSYLATMTLPVYASTICNDLKQQFSIIKEVIYKQKNENNCLLTISFYKPLYVVNQNYIMLESGMVTIKDNFIPESIDSLYHLSISLDRTDALLLLTKWLEKSSNTIFDLFTVQLINTTEIILTDKQSKNFELRCYYKVYLTENLLKQSLKFKDEIQRLASLNKKLGYCWVVDLRFDKQIILYQKRGKNEGQSLF